jgi:hypothetical protein
MLRVLILLVFGGAVAFVVSPFVLASRELEARGIKIQGRVYHKSEYVKVRYSGWSRSRDVTIEYPVPETGGVSFFDVHPDEQHYDALRGNQVVNLRYLLRRDLPKFPMTDVLWQLHALPTVRMVDPQGEPGLNKLMTPSAFTPGVVIACEAIVSLAGLLLLWRVTRWRPFAWTAGIGIAVGLGFLFLQDFPRATPPPSVGVRHASGHVTSFGTIDKLFSGSRERGIVADQPVNVVGVEFVPEGRNEPVVAVDLIDRGSIAGLKEQSAVSLQYEAGSPRIAYIDGATRTFPKRNLSGAMLQGVMVVAVLIGLFAASQLIGKGFNRLIKRRD